MLLLAGHPRYYIGGATTTREAFEVGQPVVTLPGAMLGSRSTHAYYTLMNVYDYVARDRDE